LRAIEEKQVRRVGGLHDAPIDVRIIAATNRNPDELVDAGTFRRDLLYRLNVLTVTLPPLRDRPEDIQLLADGYLALYARKYGRPQKRFTDEARALLASDPWIGNVRELAHVIERAVLLEDGEMVAACHLRPPGNGSSAPARVPDPAAPSSQTTLSDLERTHIRRVLDEKSWNVSEAARQLGVSRESLRYRMRKYGLAGRRS
jgi:two-component system response regulator AtoC